MLMRLVVLLICCMLSIGCQTAAKRDRAEHSIDKLLFSSLITTPPADTSSNPTDEQAFNALLAKYNGETDIPKRTVLRNRLAYIVLAQINDYYDSNYDDLYENAAITETMVDFAVLGLGLGGAFASEASSQIMSAISGGLVGARAAAQKNFLNDANKFIVLTKMQTLRSTKRTEILRNLSMLSAEQYTLEMLGHDLLLLLNTGSIRDAVTKDAQEKLNDLADALDAENAALNTLNQQSR
jgi:hypothetical protein